MIALFAHPGHGTTDPSSIAHYVFEPVHAVPLALIAWGVVGIVQFVAWRKRERSR